MLIAVAVASGLLLIFVLLLGPVRGSFWAFVATSAITGMFVVGGASILALAIIGWRRARPQDAYRMASVVTTGVAASLLTVLVFQGATDGAFDATPLSPRRLDLAGAQPGRSISVLLLDGYPRADVLADMGLDNTDFLEGLRERGFDVYPKSRSNYDRTPFSILSILSGAHIADIDALWQEPQPAGEAGQQRRVARALLDPPMFEALERAGYLTRALTGTVVHTPIGGADEVWNAATATDFEIALLQRTPLAAPLELTGFAIGQERTHIVASLDEFADIPVGPSFTFAHVMSPHAPLVFEADGSPAEPPPCYPAECSLFDGDPANLGMTEDEYATRFLNQIVHLNELVTDAIDDLLGRDPDAVVILLSDHGIEGDSEVAHHRNLIVARTPAHPNLLGPSPRPSTYCQWSSTRIWDLSCPRSRTRSTGAGVPPG